MIALRTFTDPDFVYDLVASSRASLAPTVRAGLERTPARARLAREKARSGNTDRTPSTQRGFTLLEMLAALTVLALCCAVLLTAFGQSAKSLQQVQRSDRLSLAARSLMDEFSNGPLHAGRSEGTWDGALRWQLNVSQQPSTTAQIALYRLDLNLDEDRRHARFSTLQARAASSGAAP